MYSVKHVRYQQEKAQTNIQENRVEKKGKESQLP